MTTRCGCFRWCLAATLFFCLAMAASVQAQSAEAAWHLPEWSHRQTVDLVTIDTLRKINTALITLEADPGALLPDGRDVRVVDADGRPVKFHLINAKGEALSGDLPKGQAVRIHFLPEDLTAPRYYVYYGNAKAAPAGQTWTKTLGGLKLETRQNNLQQPANNFKHLQKLIKGSKRVFGSGLRRQINDPANPFGPNDYYISSYDGWIYCPRDGVYSFATDSDDSSFLLINGNLVVQWPGGHNPSGAFSHFGRLSLKQGIHRIEYYHVQSGGGTLAKAGWRIPDAKEFTLIPEEAFIRELRTVNRLVESRDSALGVFFAADVRDVFRFGNDGPFVAHVALKDLSRSRLSEMATREWLSGGALLGGEPEFTAVFVGDPRREVRLRCMDKLGYSGEWRRQFDFGGDNVRHVGMDMEVSVGEAILLKDEPLRIDVKVRNDGDSPLDARLVAEIQLDDGTPVHGWGKALALRPGHWTPTQYQVAQAGGIPFETGQALFRVEFEGHTILTRRVVLGDAASGDVRLKLHAERLVDDAGNLAVVRLCDAPFGRPPEAFARKLADGESVTVLYIDDALAGAGETSYTRRFVGMVATAFPGAKVELARVGFSGDASRTYTAFDSIVAVGDACGALKPDLVVAAGSLRDIMRFTSVARFERTLRAQLDRVRATCDASAVLLAPPPVMANPGFGQSYAIAVKRVALLKELPVADAYTAFMNQRAPSREWPAGKGGDTDWRRFYRDPDSVAPIYHLAPTADGQRLLAETLWRTVFGDRPIPAAKPAAPKTEPKE